MTDKDTTTPAQRISRDFLPFVRKPARYIGGEINEVVKDHQQCDLTVALCFPDVYEVGMSNTGLGILYTVLNGMDRVAAERVFSPWTDAEQVLREKDIPLFSLESRRSLADFDVIGFSLTTELCYTNVLNMLDLAGIEVRSDARDEDWPIVIGGGTMANCCEPIADFIDIFVLGEGEEAAAELAELLIAEKRKGVSKQEILLSAARQFEWAYVPRFYQCEYDGERITAFEPQYPDLRVRFENAVVEDFENARVATEPIVPFVQAVHERVSVEIMRGCPGRCRFCQASYCKRPIRYRSVDRIFDIARASYHATGFDTVSLLSLSSAEYPELEELVSRLHEYFSDKHVGLSLPSLRVDKQLRLLPTLMTSVRKGGLTIAVEAASERLREIICKPIKDEDLFATAEAAYRAGWQRFKLYFMVGLPGETEEDISRIVELSYRLAKLRKGIDGKTGQINAAVSWFVPKPHTPFGWLAQKPLSYFQQAKELILDQKIRLRAKFLQFKFHGIERSVLESAIGRADRRLGPVIEAAWRKGAKFDLWDECFDYSLWVKAFGESGIDIETAAQRQFGRDEILPWEHLGGPGRKYLLGHLDEAVSLIDNEAGNTRSAQQQP